MLFCTAIKRVSLLNFPFHCHVQVLYEISQVCCFKYPYSCFSSHLCYLVFVAIPPVFILSALVSLWKFSFPRHVHNFLTWNNNVIIFFLFLFSSFIGFSVCIPYSHHYFHHHYYYSNHHHYYFSNHHHNYHNYHHHNYHS